MISVTCKDFRAFRDVDRVELRPLTFLVGENSSGKTSFLAAVRFVFEAFSRRSVASLFNREPYFLGGFDQIAHFRGGKGGRAREFELHISARMKFDQHRRSTRIDRDGDNIVHKFCFTKGDPQPELSSFEFHFREHHIRCNLDDEYPLIQIKKTSDESEITNYRAQSAPPSSLLKENLGFLRYIFEDLRFPRSSALRKKNLPLLESVGIGRIDQQEFYEAYRLSMESLAKDVFASAPIRTQPLRTYTPSELVASSEGAHVPLELARLKYQSAEAWEKTRSELNRFGKSAGLFTDIDIKRFGRSSIDPFQVTLKLDGPNMNIVDVGYGVSQIIPIVYQLLNPGSFDVFLLQQPEVHLHPRAQAALGSFLVNRINPRRFIVVETHSDYIIDRVRMEIAQGKVDHEHVSIVYFQRGKNETTLYNLFIDQGGNILDVPAGYREFFLHESAKLLGLE